MGHFQSKLDQKSTKLKNKVKKQKLKKFRFKKRNRKSNLLNISVDSHQISDLLQNESDIEAKKKMQDQLAFNSDIFVLNQMMMCIQLFGNFERYGIKINKIFQGRKLDRINAQKLIQVFNSFKTLNKKNVNPIMDKNEKFFSNGILMP